MGHALVGANGSGKSTLLGILSGQITPDRGTVTMRGEPVTLTNPIAALRRGITIVTQETAVAPDLTVTENLFLGGRLRRGRFGIDWRASTRAAAAAMGELDAGIDVTARVRDLRPDQQQIVEFARALTMNCDILILDEPTSSLTEDEVASVSQAIDRVKVLGVAMILVSHRFEEILALCEEVTVLRDGRTVAQGSLTEHDDDSLMELMLGHRTQRSLTRAAPASLGAGPPKLQVRRVSSRAAFTDVSLKVSPGEIVGLAGLVGSGRSELLEGIFGGRPMSGEVLVNGKVADSTTPRRLIDRGVGYVPPDRQVQGLILAQSVSDRVWAVDPPLARASAPVTH